MKKFNLALFYILLLTWALPYTIVSAIVFLFINLFLRNKVSHMYVSQGRICMVMKSPTIGGASFAFFYIMGSSTNLVERVHKHELGHTIQAALFGPIFLYIALHSVIRAGLWTKIVNKHIKKYGTRPDYYGIWFEGQANDLGNKYFDKIIIQDKQGRL